MKEVIQGAVDLLKEGQPCVLATVVRTKGSTPQKPGAMLLVRPDGTGEGTLGGGCVEGDIWFAAKEILRLGGGPEFKDYLLNEDVAARDGLVCGGTMYFYLELLVEPSDFLTIGSEILGAYSGGNPVSLATVVNSPREWPAGEPSCWSASTARPPAPWAAPSWTPGLGKSPGAWPTWAVPSR
ncbi:MAG: XdhC family protein [Dehalococcoidia bacterium]|nr:XdhC family protein [Dehalococcoidia bacterium]